MIFVFALLLGTLQLGACSTLLTVNCSARSDPTPTPPMFSNLAAAASYIRTVLQPLRDSVVVSVLPGECTSGSPDVPILALGAADSGTAQFTITYEGSPTAVLHGGIAMPPEQWTALPGGLFSAALPGLGAVGVGVIGRGGFSSCTVTRAELFSDGMPMTLARYPNIASADPRLYNGPWMHWMNVIASDAFTFTFNDTRGAVWASTNATLMGQDVWVHGFWGYDWADTYLKVVSITAKVGTPGVFVIAYSPTTLPAYPITPKARFRLLNLPSEVDAPGEYFFDDAAKRVFFMPPGGSVGPSVFIGAASTPLIVFNGGASFISLKSFRLMYGRQYAVATQGNVVSRGLRLESLDASNFGKGAVSLNNVQDTLIRRVTGTGHGCSSLSVSGGNKTSLATSNIEVSECDFSLYARWTRTYAPGIRFAGVGVYVTNNTVSNAPHQGMTGSGNNHIFTDNVFDTLCYGVTDSSAWYMGRSWVQRGVVLARNVFKNIRVTEPVYLGSPSVQGLYLDDQQSGVAIVNNTCIGCMACMLIGGGRDNLISGNRCEHVDTFCVHFDNRGMTWQPLFCTYNASYTGQLVADLFTVRYTSPPYSTEYPQLPPTLTSRPCVPVNNTFVDNTYCDVKNGFIDRTEATAIGWGSVIANNMNDTRCLSVPVTPCPIGTVRPNCRKCNTSTDCASHAKWVDVNQDATMCTCTCRNQWSGRDCNKCDAAKFSGTDCDRCATGLNYYPICVPEGVTVNITLEAAKCASRCAASGCTNHMLTKVVADYLCSCAGCTQVMKRVCSNTTKAVCTYPLYKCQMMRGKDMCVVTVGGKNTWDMCGPC